MMLAEKLVFVLALDHVFWVLCHHSYLPPKENKVEIYFKLLSGSIARHVALMVA